MEETLQPVVEVWHREGGASMVGGTARLPFNHRRASDDACRVILAFDIERLTMRETFLGTEYAFDVDKATKSSSVVRSVIGVIHAVPGLHAHDITRETLHVYLGRSSPGNVSGRLRRHAAEKGHLFAAILCKGAPSRIDRIEALGNWLLTKLKKTGRLCIASANIRTGGGPLPSGRRALIYLTWGKMREEKITLPTVDAIQNISDDAEERFGTTETTGLEPTLMTLRQPERHMESVMWAPGHAPF